MHTLKPGRIVVATDLHYGLGRNSKSKLGILKDRVEPQLLAELDSGKEDKTFVMCGDLFHEMVSVRTDIYQEARRFVTECAKRAHVILLAGNHDCYDDTTDITSVELFDHLENVEVVRRPQERELYGLKCLLLPWSDNNMSAFDFQDGSYDCVFCHPDVPKEFFMGLFVLDNNRKMSATEANAKRLAQDDLVSSGLDKTAFSDGSENDRLASSLESVRKVVSLAKKGGYIFAGHIHKHSESLVLGRRFTFVGAPYQTTSEEIDTKSGFYAVGPAGVEFKEVHAPEYVKVRFSEVKEKGVDAYDFSRIRGNIIQFDGDAVITVELEARLKKRILDEGPYEVSETDYSNLVAEQHSVENSEKYQKAFAASPKGCVDLYIESLPDDMLAKEKVERRNVKKVFDAIYELIERQSGASVSEGGASIRYKTLTATNFLSYDRLEFDFEGSKGLTLIYGKNLDNVGATNACGKSNIIKALVYALFGRFPKKVKKENMCQWDSASRDVDVTITLESNGTEYRIESGMLRGRDSYHRVYNVTEGKDLTRKQLAETRKFIETEILHCGFDMFMKTTVLTSSEIFNFYCMKKEDKDDYLNTIFGTKTLNEVRENIKTSMKGYRTQFMESSRLLESKEHDIELNRKTSEEFEAARRANSARIAGEIADLERQRAELDAERERLAAERSDSDARELSDAKARLDGINAEVAAARREVSELNRALSDCSTTEALYVGELMKHKGLMPKLCPDCKKVVSKEYKISEYVKKIEKARADASSGKERLAEADDRLKKLEAERDSASQGVAVLQNKVRQTTFDESRVARMDALVESKRSMKRFVEEQDNPNTRIIESLEADKTELEAQLDEMEARIRTLEFVQTKVVSQEVITNLLTSKFIQQLNERIRYYLQRLGLNLGVEFDNDFQYEFVRGNGAHPEFNSLSGGESLRIVIATSFAFKDFLESRRNLTSNIRFLDEFFEKDADNLGMNSTVAILKDFSRIMDQNVFLISNKLNEIDDSVFDNVLVVTIRNGRSTIEKERVE